jgi:hypothetical protein
VRKSELSENCPGATVGPSDSAAPHLIPSFIGGLHCQIGISGRDPLPDAEFSARSWNYQLRADVFGAGADADRVFVPIGRELLSQKLAISKRYRSEQVEGVSQTSRELI